jgi:hypothetical protein
MASKKWLTLPGGRIKRWKKSRTEDRPGWGSSRFPNQVPPRWFRNRYNRKERRRCRAALSLGIAEARPYVHPREAAWYW